MKKNGKTFFEISKLDETNSMEDVSFSNYTNSSNNDYFKFKLKAIPLSKKELYNLVSQFGGIVIPEMTEEDFLIKLQDEFYFKNIRENNLDICNIPIKNNYLRKSVCIELLKVLMKLVKIKSKIYFFNFFFLNFNKFN